MKEKLLGVTRSHYKSLADIQKRLGRYSGAQVQAGSLLSAVQVVASIWFDQVRPALEAASFSPEITRHGTDVFDRMLRFAKRRPTKTRLLAVIGEAVALYKELIHAIETTSFAGQGTLNITPYIDGLNTDEGEYLEEAQRCLRAIA